MPELRNFHKNATFANLMLDYINGGGRFLEEAIIQNASKIRFGVDLLQQSKIASRFLHGRSYERLASLNPFLPASFIRIPDVSNTSNKEARIDILYNVLSNAGSEIYDANKSSDVVSLILWRLYNGNDGKSRLQILVGNKERNNQSFWYPLGGKISHGESAIDALRRELREEVEGLDDSVIDAGKVPEFISISKTPFADSARTVRIHTFSQYIGDNPQLLEASSELSSLRWIDVDMQGGEYMSWHKYMAINKLTGCDLADNAKFIVILLHEWFNLTQKNFVALSKIRLA